MTGRNVLLVMAKAKIAPIKRLTVPKLKLTVVFLSARLINYVLDAYENVLNFNHVYVWCDSKVVLHWVQSNKVLPTYMRSL